MTDKKCPQCGGPANHPVGSSACKRIGIQRTDKDKAFADYDVSVKRTARRRDFNAGWDAHAERVKDVIEAVEKMCDTPGPSQAWTESCYKVEREYARLTEQDGKGNE